MTCQSDYRTWSPPQKLCMPREYRELLMKHRTQYRNILHERLCPVLVIHLWHCIGAAPQTSALQGPPQTLPTAAVAVPWQDRTHSTRARTVVTTTTNPCLSCKLLGRHGDLQIIRDDHIVSSLTTTRLSFYFYTSVPHSRQHACVF
jgi:hypothetical protein